MSVSPVMTLMSSARVTSASQAVLSSEENCLSTAAQGRQHGYHGGQVGKQSTRGELQGAGGKGSSNCPSMLTTLHRGFLLWRLRWTQTPEMTIA